MVLIIYRDMKKIYLTGISIVLISLLLFGFTDYTNIKTKDPGTEQGEQWRSLFNGVNLDGWTVKIKGYPLGENIHNTFRVEDSILKVSYDGYGNSFGEAYGHIFYKKPFSSYRLRLSYRFVGEQPADGQEWAYKNSGIMIHSQAPESMALDQGFPVSLEVQLLGGKTPGIERPTGNLCTPGTHVDRNGQQVMEHCIQADAPTFYGNEWVEVEIEVYRDSLIRHIINGKEVIRYSKPVYGGEFLPDTDFWRSMDGQPVTGGYISLQSESHPVEFKKIELLELK